MVAREPSVSGRTCIITSFAQIAIRFARQILITNRKIDGRLLTYAAEYRRCRIQFGLFGCQILIVVIWCRGHYNCLTEQFVASSLQIEKQKMGKQLIEFEYFQLGSEVK